MNQLLRICPSEANKIFSFSLRVVWASLLEDRMHHDVSRKPGYLLKICLMTLCLFSVFSEAGETRLKIMLGQNDNLAHLDFEVTQPTEIKIEGLVSSDYLPGKEGEQGIARIFTCWIIEGVSRREVWNLMEVRNRMRRLKGPIDFSKKVSLPVGQYEVYLARVKEPQDPPPRWNNELLLKENPYLILTADANAFQVSKNKGRIRKMTDSAVASINRARNNSAEVRYFRIRDKETTLRLYAIGEGKRRAGSIFDFAWIEDLTRNRKIWSMNPRKCEYAGGSRKNIMTREVITLQPGKYAVHYESDGSHAFDSWSDVPPADPFFWGITLWPDTEDDVSHVLVLKERARKEPLLAMIGIGDNQHLIKGLEIKETMGIRLQCLGEGNWRQGMADFGWIEDAQTGEKVWSMDIKSTVHAGGADKNRMAHEVLKLEPGKYLVHYQTDDSHSYPKWNAPEPFKSQTWGIMLFPTDHQDYEKIATFDKVAERAKPLVSILKPRGNAYLEGAFKLSEETRLRVEAMGEGLDGTMYDHGWIENDDTGRIVWQMHFEKTRHAGGSKKNRLSRETITLPKGNYKLLYETDEDHHYGHWNEPKPANSEQYGIAIYLVR